MNNNMPAVKIVFVPSWLKDFIDAAKSVPRVNTAPLNALNVEELLSAADIENLKVANWFFQKHLVTGLSTSVILSSKVSGRSSAALEFPLTHNVSALNINKSATAAVVNPTIMDDLQEVVVNHFNRSKVEVLDQTIVVYGNSMEATERTKSDLLEDVLVSLAASCDNDIAVNRNPLFLDYLLCS